MLLFLYILQIDLPDSVTERCIHSLSAFIMGPHCVQLIVIGGQIDFKKVDIREPNITMVIELGKSVITHTVWILY